MVSLALWWGRLYFKSGCSVAEFERRDCTITFFVPEESRLSVAGNTGVVNVFASPYEHWSFRQTTMEEAIELIKQGSLSLSEALHKKDRLLEVVSTHNDAAAHMLRERANNALENHVERALDKSVEYRNLLALMPEQVPAALDAYQGEFPHHDSALADDAIRGHGVMLADGQMLFHGGRWPIGDQCFTSTRPFSTSFCPQVALRNAEWRGKAFDAERVELMVVRVKEPATKAFAFRREGNHGNEKEVVFASGANLSKVREIHIADVTVTKINERLQSQSKVVPAYLVEVEIS